MDIFSHLIHLNTQQFAKQGVDHILAKVGNHTVLAIWQRPPIGKDMQFCFQIFSFDDLGAHTLLRTSLFITILQ